MNLIHKGNILVFGRGLACGEFGIVGGFIFWTQFLKEWLYACVCVLCVLTSELMYVKLKLLRGFFPQ